MHKNLAINRPDLSSLSDEQWRQLKDNLLQYAAVMDDTAHTPPTHYLDALKQHRPALWDELCRDIGVLMEIMMKQTQRPTSTIH
jgi:hypothetical protein